MTDDEITDAIEIEPEIPHRLDREIFETDTLLKTLLLWTLAMSNVPRMAGTARARCERPPAPPEPAQLGGSV